ncbi:uncharacterized protein V1518DRAFT_431142 [Limtongia smithiae]|uniref:uncharacterized protein n=1 Tax=Limtongia smithiae TaxID=1125753 RepID=UPI0034CFE436
MFASGSRALVPLYVAPTAALAVLSSDPLLRAHALTALPPRPAALAALNAFLDHLLFHIFGRARSATISSLRSAVLHLFKNQLGTDAVNEGEAELRTYLGKTPEDEAQISSPSSSDEFHAHAAWETTRARCMVYSSLGNLEESDVLAHTPGENSLFPSSPTSRSNVSPITTIFLTAILEVVAEHILLVSGRAALSRYIVAIAAGQLVTPGIICLEEADVDKLAVDPQIGKMWRQWLKRGKELTGSSSPLGPSQLGSPRQMYPQSPLSPPPKTPPSSAHSPKLQPFARRLDLPTPSLPPTTPTKRAPVMPVTPVTVNASSEESPQPVQPILVTKKTPEKQARIPPAFEEPRTPPAIPRAPINRTPHSQVSNRESVTSLSPSHIQDRRQSRTCSIHSYKRSSLYESFASMPEPVFVESAMLAKRGTSYSDNQEYQESTIAAHAARWRLSHLPNDRPISLSVLESIQPKFPDMAAPDEPYNDDDTTEKIVETIETFAIISPEPISLPEFEEPEIPQLSSSRSTLRTSNLDNIAEDMIPAGVYEPVRRASAQADTVASRSPAEEPRPRGGSISVISHSDDSQAPVSSTRREPSVMLMASAPLISAEFCDASSIDSGTRRPSTATSSTEYKGGKTTIPGFGTTVPIERVQKYVWISNNQKPEGESEAGPSEASDTTSMKIESEHERVTFETLLNSDITYKLTLTPDKLRDMKAKQQQQQQEQQPHHMIGKKPHNHTRTPSNVFLSSPSVFRGLAISNVDVPSDSAQIAQSPSMNFKYSFKSKQSKGRSPQIRDNGEKFRKVSPRKSDISRTDTNNEPKQLRKLPSFMSRMGLAALIGANSAKDSPKEAVSSFIFPETTTTSSDVSPADTLSPPMTLNKKESMENMSTLLKSPELVSNSQSSLATVLRPSSSGGSAPNYSPHQKSVRSASMSPILPEGFISSPRSDLDRDITPTATGISGDAPNFVVGTNSPMLPKQSKNTRHQVIRKSSVNLLNLFKGSRNVSAS